MATFDTSMYSVQPRSFADYEAQADAAEGRKLGAQSNRLALALQQRQLGQAESADREAADLKRALQALGPQATDQDLMTLLKGRGDFDRAGKLQTDILTRQTKEAELREKQITADKHRIEQALKQFEIIGQAMGPVRDQAGYDAARQQLSQALPAEVVARIPAVYDPAAIERNKAQAMSVKDRLEQEWKAKGYDLEVRKQAGTEANDLMTPDGRGGFRVNQPLAAAKAAVARAGASQVNVNATQEKEEGKAVGKFLGEQYADIQKAGIGAQGRLDRAARMEQLLERIQTGKLEGVKKDAAALAQTFGITIDPNLAEKEAFEALSNQLALEARNPSGGAGMPGAMSDKDREFLQAITPNLTKTPEGNRTILETNRKIAKRDAEVARLAREYRKKSGTLDEGFFEELRQFSDANPLFGVTAAKPKPTPRASPAATPKNITVDY